VCLISVSFEVCARYQGGGGAITGGPLLYGQGRIRAAGSQSGLQVLAINNWLLAASGQRLEATWRYLMQGSVQRRRGQ
jgi:hypothetical protein